MASTASTGPTWSDNAGRRGSVVPSTSSPNDVQVIRLLTTASKPRDPDVARTTYHIYHEKERHKRIQSKIDLKSEGPKSAVGRAARKAKKRAKKGVVVETEAEPDAQAEPEYKHCGAAFFLHSPYLSFHDPPKVLYLGEDKHASPAVLIHGSAFWRKYKLQYGDSLAIPGVIDARGVVCWKHNGGNKKELKADDKKLKGYKGRTWRLWGETGKAYVHGLKASKAGTGPDPDELAHLEAVEKDCPVQAEGVVYLKWEHPFSRHTRRYHFRYGNVDLYWKGTGTMKKRGFCGVFVRYNHLKLVAKIPVTDAADSTLKSEVCLGTYTCSVSGKKCGRLELFDSVLLQLAEVYVQPINEIEGDEPETAKVLRLKQTWFYRIIVATAMCMINAEKEKRQAVWEWLENAAEGGG